MKKLNITKDKFTESKYFTTKYGKLEYVSESGNVYKTSKGHVLKFVNESDSEYKETANEIKMLLKSKTSARGVSVYCGGLAPYLVFVRLDALDEKDWPHGISDNSLFVEFIVDLRVNSVEFHRGGCIPYNKDDPQAGIYYGMGTNEFMKRMGLKIFRKGRFKSIEELVGKMNSFYETFVMALEEYKGEYPYREGININESESVDEELKVKAMAAAKLLGVIAFLGDDELDKKYELFSRQKNIRASKMADAILDIKAYRDAAHKLNDERVGGKFVGSPDEY